MAARKCEVEGCGMTDGQLPIDCNLVPFPDDVDAQRKSAWIEFVKGKGSTWKPQARSRICTQHFETNCFYNGRRGSRLLKSTVPTLVSNPSQMPTYDTVAETSSWSAAAKPLYHRPPLGSQVQVPKKVCAPIPPKVVSGSSIEEEEHLNRVQLKKSIKGLLIHLDYLCKQFRNDPIKETEVKSMRYILLKVLHHINLNPHEALKMFQEQIAEKNYNHLRRLVKVEKKQFNALVRSFSLSLHFYSIHAYCYLRQKLRGAIPHPRTIQAWYSTIDKYMV